MDDPPQIVPTPVGVNRICERLPRGYTHCPHTRGGEPVAVFPQILYVQIVPTPVGVNRLCALDFASLTKLSPHPWG